MFEGSSFWYLHRILNCCRQIFWPLLFEKVNSTLVSILLFPYSISLTVDFTYSLFWKVNSTPVCYEKN